MTDDIVARLRREMWYQPGFKINQWGKPNQVFELTRTNLIAADEIERLRAERDEARREVTHLRPSVCLGAQTANAYADQRGWDCFKEVR